MGHKMTKTCDVNRRSAGGPEISTWHAGRRAFIQNLGWAPSAPRSSAPPPASTPASAQAVAPTDVLNFALNLEYLEATFYHYAFFGTDIPAADTTRTPRPSAQAPLRHRSAAPVPFASPIVKAYAQEIAAEELKHVQILRAVPRQRRSSASGAQHRHGLRRRRQGRRHQQRRQVQRLRQRHELPARLVHLRGRRRDRLSRRRRVPPEHKTCAELRRRHPRRRGLPRGDHPHVAVRDGERHRRPGHGADLEPPLDARQRQGRCRRHRHRHAVEADPGPGERPQGDACSSTCRAATPSPTPARRLRSSRSSTATRRPRPACSSRTGMNGTVPLRSRRLAAIGARLDRGGTYQRPYSNNLLLIDRFENNSLLQ